MAAVAVRDMPAVGGIPVVAVVGSLAEDILDSFAVVDVDKLAVAVVEDIG